MKKSILGIDIGYGDVKVSYLDREGNLKKFKFSSIIADAPLEAVDMPILEGRRYYMEEEALMRDSKDIVEITDYQHLEKFSVMFLWKALEKLKIKPEDVDYIVTGLSLAQYGNGEQFKKRLSKFKINKDNFDFTGKISLLAQGLGAKYAIEKNFEEKSMAYLIIDIGFSTIDVVDVINGKVRPENIKGYTNEGIIKIARSLQEYILEHFNEVVSLKEVKEILKTKQFILEGTPADLTTYISEISKKYTEHTMKTLKIRYEREFKKYSKVYFVGGGAYFIDKSISPIIETVKEPEYYNSLGNVYFREQKEG